MSLSRPIGLFDSGIGGFSILKEAQKLLPHENFLYYADEAHYPYGEKSRAEIEEYSRKAAEFLLEREAKILVIACHTASACALDFLQHHCQVPVIGMIEPSLELAQQADLKNLTLLGSRALIHSQLYQSHLARKLPEVTLRAVDGQELVSVAQEKRSDGKEVAQKLLLGDSSSALFLACTHFSCLKPLLQEVVGEKVLLLDPAEKMAKCLVSTLEKNGLLNPQEERGTCRFYSSATSIYSIT